MARVLSNERRKPHESRAKCTHIARLAERGDADMLPKSKLWDRLKDHTHAEAQRVLLGAQLTSCRNLCNLTPCEDGDCIKDTVSVLNGKGRSGGGGGVQEEERAALERAQRCRRRATW